MLTYNSAYCIEIVKRKMAKTKVVHGIIILGAMAVDGLNKFVFLLPIAEKRSQQIPQEKKM